MIGPHQATIKDIARRLKISVSTVSRALRGSADISDETRRLVLSVAEELQYSPNPIALSLRDKKTRAIGVIVQEIANNYCSAVIAGIEDVAFKMGYNVLIAQSHEKIDLEIINTRLLASRRVDGMLITISNETSNVDHLHEMIAKGIPVVMFDRVSDELQTHKVVVDDYKGAFDATSHLIEQGYKNIAHLTIAKQLTLTQNRLNGYLDALKVHRIPVRKEWIVYCDFDEGNMKSEVRKLLLGKHRPNAIFSSVERLSMASVKVLKELNLKVPADMALAGFADNPLSRYLSPALTTVGQPTFSIGQNAAELLIELIESKKAEEKYTTIKLKTTLDVQESSVRRT
ncbi:MAG TPA: LacI family DNA-binding transcriptional regulator [Chitinophagaceae bacterium]|nr:LacI family DNA-binding transcriptional regulator [Chitinophagaceae bacterium]